MGKLAVYKYISMMFLVVQCIVSTFTIVALFGGDVTPVGHSARAMLVYILPVLIALNLVLLIYWLIRRKWLYALIPVITVACCIPYIGTLIQFGSVDKKAEAEKGLKIATYNVAMFGRETSGFLAQDILSALPSQRASCSPSLAVDSDCLSTNTAPYGRGHRGLLACQRSCNRRIHRDQGSGTRDQGRYFPYLTIWKKNCLLSFK